MVIRIQKSTGRSLVVNVSESDIKAAKSKKEWTDRILKVHRNIPNISTDALAEAFAKAYDDIVPDKAKAAM